MQTKFLLPTLLLCGAFVGFATPPFTYANDESKPTAEAKNKQSPWKPEDFIYGESGGQSRISPDSKWVVWVKSTADKEKDGRVSNLVLSSLSDSTEIELTRGSDHNNSPLWSPNGERIAFLSDRKRAGAKPDTGGTQIWLINPHGGEPWSITEFARSPQQFEWLDNDTIVFSAQEDKTLFEQEVEKKKDDSQVVEDEAHEPPVRLYKYNVKEKKVTRLTNNTDWIEDWAVSYDGKYAIARHGKTLKYAFDQKVQPVTILHNLQDGSEKIVQNGERFTPRSFEWARDNSGFYAVAPFSTDPRFQTASIEVVYFYDVATGKLQHVNLDWDNGVGFNLQAVPGGFLAALAAGAHHEIGRFTASKNGDSWTWKRENLSGENSRNLESFRVSDDGKTLVYLASTASKLPQLYATQLNPSELSPAKQISKLNEGLVSGRAYAKTEVIRWKGSGGDDIEGILYYPTNYEAGKKYPVITAIHGGPLGADYDLWDESWAYALQLYTQRGAFVLRPNYHGSSSYGLKFAESICCGKYYDLETPDINAGVDYLIGKGLGDPDRVATLGWSNGSILSTSLLITYPDRYKVAAVGAGDVEWISDWANVNFGESFDAYYFGKSPMQDPDLYIRKSPFFKMDRIKAPVLIFHGNADRNVPFAQSWDYFRALQWHGKVPVKFVVFPGEPHGPRKLTHQLRKVEEEAAWFDKYFFKTEKLANEALKEGSPLETVFRTKTIAKSGVRYGVDVTAKPKSILTPEVVKRGELEIGRFEVTRAQFAEFDKSYKFDAGTENYPANGITLDQAKAYADWLSKTTKQTWRVPNKSEVESLYGKKDGENTLDYWAGYALNPEDAALLTKKASELSGSAPLLKAVGSFSGQGKEDEELVFDLGGNVAEWALLPDGKGEVLGGSADQPADERSKHSPNAAYVGFRVVRGAAKPDPKPDAK